MNIVTSYAEDLMKLLQIQYRNKGKITKDDVKTFEKMIDYHGISGIQHAMVVSLMREYWELFNENLF